MMLIAAKKHKSDVRLVIGQMYNAAPRFWKAWSLSFSSVFVLLTVIVSIALSVNAVKVSTESPVTIDTKSNIASSLANSQRSVALAPTMPTQSITNTPNGTNNTLAAGSVEQQPDDVKLEVGCIASSSPNGNVFVDRYVGVILTRYAYFNLTNSGSAPGNLAGNPILTPKIVGAPQLIDQGTMSSFGGLESRLYIISDTNAPASDKVTTVLIDRVNTVDGRSINFAADFSNVDQSCATFNPNKQGSVVVRLLPGGISVIPTPDTRPAGKIQGNTSVKVHAGNPGETIIGNLTVNQPAGGGFVTTYACNEGIPNSSSINFSAGQTIANAVIAKADSNGDICFWLSPDSGSAHILWDQSGATTAFKTNNPARLLDTRTTMHVGT